MLPGVQQVEPAERPLVPGEQDPPYRRVHDVVPGRCRRIGGQERTCHHVIPHFESLATVNDMVNSFAVMASARVPPARAGAASSTAHRWCVAYERHGRQRSAAASEPARGPPLAPALLVPGPLAPVPLAAGSPWRKLPERPRHPDVPRQEHVRVRQRPHPDVSGGPRPDPRQRQQPGANLVPVRAGIEADVTASQRGSQRDQRPPPRQRHRQRGRVEAGDRRRVRKDMRQCPRTQRRRPRGTRSRPPKPAASTDAGSGVPHSATSRAASRRAAATETCWPSTALMAISFPSTAPTARRPGTAAASGPITGSPAKNPRSRKGRHPGRAAAGSAARRRSRRAGQTARASSPPSSRRELGAGRGGRTRSEG